MLSSEALVSNDELAAAVDRIVQRMRGLGENFKTIAGKIDQSPDGFRNQFLRFSDTDSARNRLRQETTTNLLSLLMAEHGDKDGLRIASDLVVVMTQGRAILKPTSRGGASVVDSMAGVCVEALEEIAELTSESHRAAEDGVIDDRERELLRSIADRLITTMAGVVEILKKG